MKRFILFFFFLLAAWGLASNGDCLTNLGETYTVPQGSTFNQPILPITDPDIDILVGTLNVAGTYNLISGHLYVNEVNISGTFTQSGGSFGGNTWYGGNDTYSITQTGHYNLTGGRDFYGWDVTNNGNITVNGLSFSSPKLINDGIISYIGNYDYTKQMNFGIISNLDISKGVVTDITGVQGLILTYNSSSPENTYLDNKSYLLSGGGLLTNFHDVVAATIDRSYYYTTPNGADSISFDYWWEMGLKVPPYQQGYNFDVLALQEGSGWQYIGQIDAYTSSTGWMTAGFSLPEPVRTGTQFRFVLNDYYPDTNPLIYLRDISIHTPIPEPSTMLLVGSGLIGLVGFRKKFKG